jgi:CDP-glucose 4,6-dehydratase
VNLLEAVRQTGGPRVVVVVTTDKCYENREWIWGYRENDALGGRDPYASSKACAELVTSAFRNSFFPSKDINSHKIAIASARAGNVLGGGDWTRDQLVPDIMKAFMEGKPALIRSPNAIRPWQFVLDTLNGYLTLAEHLYSNADHYSEGFNFGPAVDDVKPVSWVAEHLSNHWGDGARWVVDGADHPHEAHFLKLDSTKAREMLSWAPKLTLPQTVEWVVEWYRAFHENKEMRALTEAQIARYEMLPAFRVET